MMTVQNPAGELALDDEYRVGQQLCFDPLDWQDSGYEPAAAAAQALARRNLWARALKKKGYIIKCWVLTGQLREYKSFGVDDGRVRNVYYLTIKAVA